MSALSVSENMHNVWKSIYCDTPDMPVFMRSIYPGTQAPLICVHTSFVYWNPRGGFLMCFLSYIFMRHCSLGQWLPVECTRNKLYLQLNLNPTFPRMHIWEFCFHKCIQYIPYVFYVIRLLFQKYSYTNIPASFGAFVYYTGHCRTDLPMSLKRI